MAPIVSPVPGRGNVEPRQFAALRRNIENTYKSTDDSVRANGLIWYPRRHDEAVDVGRMARIKGGGSEQEMPDHVRGAGIISALSPQLGWEPNLRAAQEFARTGRTSAQTGDNKAKAQAIREGIHPDQVLDPKITGGKSHKTYNFFHNIAEPDAPDYVTIDRHAHDIAVGHRYGSEVTESRGLSAAGRYNTFAEAYKQAAHHLGVALPHEVQAATWLHWTGRPE